MQYLAECQRCGLCTEGQTVDPLMKAYCNHCHYRMFVVIELDQMPPAVRLRYEGQIRDILFAAGLDDDLLLPTTKA